MINLLHFIKICVHPDITFLAMHRFQTRTQQSPRNIHWQCRACWQTMRNREWDAAAQKEWFISWWWLFQRESEEASFKFNCWRGMYRGRWLPGSCLCFACLTCSYCSFQSCFQFRSCSHYCLKCMRIQGPNAGEILESKFMKFLW